MKKLCRKGVVHPSPSPKPPIIANQNHLSFLPPAILTLAAALSPEDREVLAYLISCSNNSFSNRRKTDRSQTSTFNYSSTGHIDHPPSFTCDCFSCYMSFWVRWDSSPNHQLIHEIIDALEGGLSVQLQGKINYKNRKDRRKRKENSTGGSSELKRSELGDSDSVEESSCSGGGGGEEEDEEEGSVWRFVSYVGERIWGVFG